MCVCKACAEQLELRVVKHQFIVEKYLSMFADVSSMLHALGDKILLKRDSVKHY